MLFEEFSFAYVKVMKRLLTLYFIFVLLMLAWSYLPTYKRGVISNKKDFILRPSHERILKRLPGNQKKYFNVTAAFVVGDEKKGQSKIKSPYKSLGLLHLFTPSGFHLQALLLCFSFLGFKKHKRKFLFSFLFLFLLPDFIALKRIVVLKIAESYQTHFKKWIPETYYLFFIVFFLFFLAGDYSQNPLSFSLSFLFLGTIYALKENPKLTFIHYFFAFFIAQILVQFFLPQEITLGHFLIGFFLGMFFNILFPFMILGYLFLFLSEYFSKKLMSVLLLPTKFFHELCVYFANTQFSMTNFHGAILLTAILLLGVRHFLPRHFSKLAIIICLTFFSSGIKKERKIKKRDQIIYRDSLKEAEISHSKSL